MDRATVLVNCPACRKGGRVPGGFAGRRIKCGKCGERFVVPSPEIEPDLPPDEEILLEDPIPKELFDIVTVDHPGSVGEPSLATPFDADSLVASAAEEAATPAPTPAPLLFPATHRSEPSMPETIREYKVLTQKDKWFSGKFDPAALESAMNAYAKQGWRVLAVTTASVPGFGGNRDEMIVVLER